MNFFGLTKTHFYLIFTFAVITRLCAWTWNDNPWGDIIADAAIARNFAHTGNLGFAEIGPHDYPLSSLGYRPADQRPPLFPFLASFLIKLGLETYTSLKVLTLISGVLLIYFLLGLCHQFWPKRSPAPVGWAAALSYFLFDNSANGNLYTIQALGILATLYFYCTDRKKTAACLLGLTWMINYQSSFLWFALLIAMIFKYGFQKALYPALRFFLLALLCASPVMIRNYSIWGHPLYEINSTTFAYKSGVRATWEMQDNDYVKNFHKEEMPLHERASVMGRWMFYNIPFILRKLVLTAALFLPWIWVNRFELKKKWATPSTQAIILAILMYVTILILFPVVKYRYFLLLTLFTFILGLPRTRQAISLLLGSVILISILTGIRSNWSPVYYSGALTASATRPHEMRKATEDWQEAKQVVQFIKDEGLDNRKIMADRATQYLLDRPTIRLVAPLNRSLVEFAQHYNCDVIASRRAVNDLNWELLGKRGFYHVYIRKKSEK